MKTGLVAAANEGTEQQRQQSGLPPYAKGQIPLGGGKSLDLARYTPFGVTEGGPEGAYQLLPPQVSSAGLNTLGLTWYGKPLPPGTDRLAVAMNTAAETFTPFLARIRQVREKGGSSVPGSTALHPKTKPDTSSTIGAGLDKAFNPAHAQGAGGGGSFDRAFQGSSSGSNSFDGVFGK